LRIKKKKVVTVTLTCGKKTLKKSERDLRRKIVKVKNLKWVTKRKLQTGRRMEKLTMESKIF